MTKTNKLFATLLMLFVACTNATNTRVNAHPTVPQLTEINMSPYNVSRPPPPTTLTLRGMIANAPEDTHAQTLHMYAMEETSPVRPFVRGPWNGVCINASAEAQISTAASTVASSVQNDDYLRLQTLSAYAQRDIAILRSDFHLLTASMNAQINEREIAIRDQQQTISTLRNNNLWTAVGVGLGGLLLGFGVSGVILLTR